MLKIGERKKLEVLRSTSEGTYLGGDGGDQVLLPAEDGPADLKVGDKIEVFVYRDAESRSIATTSFQKIALDSFACLEVTSVDKEGVFFDMGMNKTLLVPKEEQNADVSAGDKRIVHMFLDKETDNLLGSMKWKEFCFKEEANFELNQKVNIIIGEETDLGRNVLIDNAFYGLIYDNEIFEELEIGEAREAYIKAPREDEEIDVSLQELGYKKIVSAADKVLELLKENEGVLEIGDKSSPELVTALTGMSKKTFKKAIGDLYRRKLIMLDNQRVRLKDGTSED